MDDREWSLQLEKARTMGRADLIDRFEYEGDWLALCEWMEIQLATASIREV
jgi:hypothetical protein